MKTIQRLTTLAGLSLVLFALGATGARAQAIKTPHFAGTFNLPFEAQWGRATLPAGNYSLYYGRLHDGARMVEVVGKKNHTPHVLILPQGLNDASTTQSALVCVREGNVGIVRALEMPQINQSVKFGMPRGTQLTANRSNGKNNVQIAEGPKLIQRIPVTMNAK